jgi:CDP-diacylglycerol--glycerol-3-phosphate 3-phosphatidyltransferase
MWLLAVTSLVTLGQRVHAVRTSPGAMEPLETDSPQPQSDSAQPDADSQGEASGT